MSLKIKAPRYQTTDLTLTDESPCCKQQEGYDQAAIGLSDPVDIDQMFDSFEIGIPCYKGGSLLLCTCQGKAVGI